MIRVSRSVFLILLGVVLVAMGAGMRLVASAALRNREASLLNARPSAPTQRTSYASVASLPPARSAPMSIRIPEMDLWNQVSPADVFISWNEGVPAQTWQVEDAGWYAPSGPPGWGRNVVIAGHSPVLDPEVWERSIFRILPYLEPGQVIELFTNEVVYGYQVAQVFAIPAKESQDQEVVAWIADSGDERLTLVTCFPPHTAANRVLVVAFPIGWRKYEP